jgi:UDP-glucose 4-epimerase
MKVLVTGGSGYIGSHTVLELIAAGHDPVIVDNFVNSSPNVLPRLQQLAGRDIPLYEIDITNTRALKRVFKQERPDAVIHFAALKAVGSSVTAPLLYYRNNLLSALSVCEAMVEYGVSNLVFSSSASVYGNTETFPIPEDAPVSPASPYAQTKVMTEQILRDAAHNHSDWQVTLLRYFNPVGAHASGQIGEDPEGIPANLWPYVARVALGKLPHLKVYGDDYDTPDGTGIRDYLHVVDLAQAHISALAKRPTERRVRVYNLGTGRGHSVLEVIAAFEQATGRKVPYKIYPRRPGDLAVSYADPTRAEHELKWKASRTISDMCADGWRWQQANPLGFATETTDGQSADASTPTYPPKSAPEGSEAPTRYHA